MFLQGVAAEKLVDNDNNPKTRGWILKSLNSFSFRFTVNLEHAYPMILYYFPIESVHFDRSYGNPQDASACLLALKSTSSDLSSHLSAFDTDGTITS